MRCKDNYHGQLLPSNYRSTTGERFNAGRGSVTRWCVRFMRGADQLCWNISFGKFGSNLENSFGIYFQNGQNKRRREKRFGTPGGWFEHRCGASQIGRALQTGRRCQHFCTFALLPAFLPCEANSWPMFVSSVVMSAAWSVRMTRNHKTISYC